MFGQWNTSQSGIAKLRLVTLQLQGEVSAASLLQLAIRHGASYRRHDVENQESRSRLRGVWTQTATVVKSSASDRTPSFCCVEHALPQLFGTIGVQRDGCVDFSHLVTGCM